MVISTSAIAGWFPEIGQTGRFRQLSDLTELASRKQIRQPIETESLVLVSTYVANSDSRLIGPWGSGTALRIDLRFVVSS